MATTENIVTLTRNLLREEDTSDVPVVSDDFLYEAIMDGQSKWEDAFNIGGESAISEQVPYGYDLASDTTLDGDVSANATTFTLSANNSSASTNSAMLLWNDNNPYFVSYTAYDSSTKIVTGASNVVVGFDDGDTVQRLYKLPSNFQSFRESPLYGDGVRVNGTPYRYTDTVPYSGGYFSMYEDDNGKYIVLPKGLTGSMSVLYNRAYTTINSADDVVSVPDKHKFFLVYHCVAMCFLDVDQAKVDKFEAKSERILNRALATRNTNKKIRTRPLSRGMIDTVTVGGYTYPIWFG